MPKEFYTERDIEDMWKRGIMSLQVTENVVLTELAYEKAERLGMQLIKEKPLVPPAAPVRPYLSQNTPMAPSPSRPDLSSGSHQVVLPTTPSQADLTARIRSAVIARLGTQIDPQLLDVIIQRVIQSTGVK